MIELLVFNKTYFRVVCLFAIVYYFINAVWIVRSANSVNNTLMGINLGDTSFRPIIELDQERAHNKLQFITETRLKLELTGEKKSVLTFRC